WRGPPPPAPRATSPGERGRQKGGVFRFLRRSAPPPPASGGGKKVASSGSPALRATSPSKWGRQKGGVFRFSGASRHLPQQVGEECLALAGIHRRHHRKTRLPTPSWAVNSPPGHQ